jgi:phosphoribosylanthranilate isomerase
MFDSGAGSGIRSDWSLLRDVKEPYFLAGGLDAGNVGEAIKELHPYAVDVSSGIETDGRKDEEKAAAFIAAVRKEE